MTSGVYIRNPKYWAIRKKKYGPTGGNRRTYKMPETQKKNIGLGNKGHIVTKKTRKKIGDANRGHFVSLETREKARVSINKFLSDPVRKAKWIKKALITRNKSPSRFEVYLEKIINKYNLPYKYTGNGTFMIGFLNPDFVNINGEKKCIEVYYSYYKNKRFGSEQKYQSWRNKCLGKYGWTAVYLNENDLKKSEEEIVKMISDKKNLKTLVELTNNKVSISTKWRKIT